jgi:ribosomal protein S18 acetylase RimI-like enzyme
MQTFERLHGLVEELEERAASRIEPLEHGRAFFNDNYRLVWDMNFVRIEREPGSWDEVWREVNEIQGAAGLSHRKMNFRDASWSQALIDQARAEGWDATSLVYMVRTDEGEKQNGGRARVVTYEDVRPFRWESSSRQSWANSDEDVKQVLNGMHSWMSFVQARHVAVEVDGRIVAASDLYRWPGVAQIEDVETLNEYQGRGFATDMVLEAASAALRDQPDATIFLIADENDWPKRFYEKLGFETVGRKYTLLRPPK